jgi:hypothetical protein
MPRLDFALHPAALAFGLFCALLAGMAIASMVYATAVEGSSGQPSVTSSGGAPDREPFVPESDGGLPGRETSAVDAEDSEARLPEGERSTESPTRNPSVQSN